MDVYEITGYPTGVSDAGVNYLQQSDSFQNMVNGFIYRQVLQSRKGMSLFAPRLTDESRVYGIFEFIKPDGTGELLAADANFLYRYNTATAVFDQLPFGGSLFVAGYTGFGLTEPEDYISGTAYPTKDNGARFVFTGKGMDHVFFYIPTNNDVRDFTDIGDNPDYSPPLPDPGTLTRAHFVFWFGERLNLIVPTVNNIEFNQGVLYSGIRDASGNGDKFRVAGSGMLQADTYEYCKGCSYLGNYLCLNFFRSNWILEKTTDAFNPYFIRRVPGVVGTDASFSAVSWDDQVDSMGVTGVVGTDGRQSLRIDNKVPNFTTDEISAEFFDVTYGGFDRVNNQFLWSYIDAAGESVTQDRVLVKNYEFDTWAVFDWRVSVFGQSRIGINLVWDDIEETIEHPSWGMWDTTEEIWNKIGIGKSIQKTLAGDNLGYIYELNADYDDYFTAITSIAPGATTTLTVNPSAFVPGDRVVVQNVEGMTQINNYSSETDPVDFIAYEVISATPTSVEINVDSSLFDPYTLNTGTLSKLISFSAETIPFNPYRPLGRRCYVSHVEFILDTNNGLLKVDVLSDQEETPFIQDVLIRPTNNQKAQEWVSMSVDHEANFLTFRLKQESPSAQLRLTSMRIHCKLGGLTSS